MPATDYITAVYSQIWSLLEAHAPFAAMVRPGNRIKLTAGRLQPFKPQKQDGDFPEAILRLGEHFADSAFTLSPLYDYYLAAGFNPAADDWPEEFRQDYALTLTHRDLRIDSADPLELEVLTALRRAGPRLGLSYVYQWGPVSGRRSEGDTSESDGSQRLATTLIIPVTMRFGGARLLG